MTENKLQYEKLTSDFEIIQFFFDLFQYGQ